MALPKGPLSYGPLLWQVICLIGGIGLAENSAIGANQTAYVSPVIVDGRLPYALDIQPYGMDAANVPGLHSFAAAQHQGEWVLLAGRTNGLHGFSFNQDNFPDESQNGEIWVIDPVTKQTWSRSWNSASGGLTPTEILSLSAANIQFETIGDRLYLSGGYGANDPTDPDSRGTFDTLTAIDLPGIVDWVKHDTGLAADHIRQIGDPLFQVTGGEMAAMGGQMHLVFGQNFDGVYNPASNGSYTNQVRTFTIQDDGTTLGFTPIQSSPPEDFYRRRDLNVAAALRPNGSGGLAEELIAYSGVFTPTRGAWTVPVEVDANGNPSMAAADDAGTFRQGMNNYHSAKVGLYSAQTGAMHEILFGGITFQEYDPLTREFVSDANFPFTNQITSVVRDASGAYKQYLLGEFPEIFNPVDARLRFGANAEFFPAADVDRFAHDILELDTIDQPTVIGYVFGGIAANAPHVRHNPDAQSAASGQVFEVRLIPFPEADFNSDGHVDALDLAIWQGALGLDPSGDADFDGDSDGADLLVWQRQFGASALTIAGSEESRQVPEPQSMILLALGVLSLSLFGRPRLTGRALD